MCSRIPPLLGDPNGSSSFAGHVWQILSRLQRIILVNKKILGSCCICSAFSRFCHVRLREGCLANRSKIIGCRPLPSVNWFTLGSIKSGIIFVRVRRNGRVKMRGSKSRPGGMVWSFLLSVVRLPRVGRRACHLHPFAFRCIPRERDVPCYIKVQPIDVCLSTGLGCAPFNTTSTTGAPLGQPSSTPPIPVAGLDSNGDFNNAASSNPIGFTVDPDDGCHDPRYLGRGGHHPSVDEQHWRRAGLASNGAVL